MGGQISPDLLGFLLASVVLGVLYMIVRWIALPSKVESVEQRTTFIVEQLMSVNAKQNKLEKLCLELGEQIRDLRREVAQVPDRVKARPGDYGA